MDRSTCRLASLLLLISLGSARADDFQQPMGGPGGKPFNLACPDRSYLAGMKVRVGDDVDQVIPVCAHLAADGSRGGLLDLPAMGERSGDEKQLICPPSHGFVKAIAVSWEGKETIILNSVSLACLPMHPVGKPLAVSLSASGAPGRNDPGFFDDLAGFVRDVLTVVEDVAFAAYLGAYGATYSMIVYGEPVPQFSDDDRGAAEPRTDSEGWNKGMSAASCIEGHTVSGVTGRAGQFVDALGLVCRPLPPSPRTLQSDKPLLRSATTADALQRATPDPRRSLPLQRAQNLSNAQQRRLVKLRTTLIPRNGGPPVPATALSTAVSSAPQVSAAATTATASESPGARAGESRGIIIVGGKDNPAGTLQPARPAASARPSTVIVGGGDRNSTQAIPATRPTAQAAVQAAAAPADPDSMRLLCRGGPLMQWREFSDTQTGTPMVGVIFQPTHTPVTEDGASLRPSECGIVGFTDYLPPAIRLEKRLAGDVQRELEREGQLWTFQVTKGHGYMQASSQQALTSTLQPAASTAAAAAATAPAAADSVPANLFKLDARTPLVIAGKKTTAGEQQRVLREAALANAGPAQKASRVRPAPPATLNTAPSVTQSAIAGHRGSTQIQGTSNQLAARQASELQMDCVRHAPRISQTAASAVPGQKFTLTGSCFGTSGRIELRGNLPAADTVLSPAVLRWTDREIELMVPGVTQVRDQSVTVAVLRADGQRSLDRAFNLRVPRERHRVPAERWQPTNTPSDTEFKSGDFGLFDVNERNEFNRSHIRSSRGYKVQGTVVIDTACELQDLDVIWRGRQLFTIQKWDEPTDQPYIGNVLVTGAPACTTKKEHTLMISGEYQHTCSFSAEFVAWASCPVGFRP